MIRSKARSARCVLLAALAGLALLGPAASSAGEADADYSRLTDYITEKGVASDSGWRTVAVQVDTERFLLAQRGAAGDIYQLSDFDGMFVKRLEWKEDLLLQVDWESPDRRHWRSLLRFDGGGENIELVEVEPRRKLRKYPGPDMAGGVTNTDFGDRRVFVPLDARPGYSGPPSNR
jgi:hypothetical protein